MMNSWSSSGVPRMIEMYVRAAPETALTGESRMRATTSATTRPSTKLITVSGMVLVSVAFSRGHSESRISSMVCWFTRLLLHGHVGLEVLLRDGLQRPVGLELAQGLVDCGDEVGALPRGDDLLRDVTGLGGDLHGGVTRGLLVVEDSQVVVHGRLDALLLQQGDGLGEALDRLDVRAGVLGDLGPVRRQALCRLLALEVGERGDRGVVRPRRDDALGDRVGVGKAVQALALGVTGNLVGDHVEPLGRQAGEDRVPRRLTVLDLQADLLRDSGGDLDVVADERVGLRVVVAERGVRALGPDLENPGLLHP